MSQENNPHIDYHEDEIDIFKIFDELLAHWRLLFGVGVLGGILGVVVFSVIPKSYTAETQVKIYKQNLDVFETDKDLGFHAIRMTDKSVVEALEKKFTKEKELTEEQFKNLQIGVKPEVNASKAPDIIAINVKSVDKDIALDFSKVINKDYCSALEWKLEQEKERKLAEVEKQFEYFKTKLSEYEKELGVYTPEKLLQFEYAAKFENQTELNGLMIHFKSNKDTLTWLNDLLPKLEKASAAEICDVFKSTCGDLATISSSSDKDRIWSIVVEYRSKQETIDKLKSALKNAEKLKNNQPPIEKLKSELTQANLAMEAFRQVTIQQIKARYELIQANQKLTQNRIEKLQKELIAQNKALRDYKQKKQEYSLVENRYNDLLNKSFMLKSTPLPKYFFEIVKTPEIVKSNQKKRLIPVVLIPVVCVGLVAFLIVFFTAYQERKHLQKSTKV